MPSVALARLLGAVGVPTTARRARRSGGDAGGGHGGGACRRGAPVRALSGGCKGADKVRGKQV